MVGDFFLCCEKSVYSQIIIKWRYNGNNYKCK